MLKLSGDKIRFSCSEKQAQVLSESTFFHTYYNPKSFDLSTAEDADALSEPQLTPLKYLKRRLAVPSADLTQSPGGQSGRSSRSNLRDYEGRVGTPNQSILGPEELSDLLADGTFMASPENSEAIFLELQRQVKRSNELMEGSGLGGLLQKLSGLLTPPEGQENQNICPEEEEEEVPVLILALKYF